STVISVLHDINLAIAYSDELILMKKGEIFAIGAPDDIITEENLREVYETECLIIKNPMNGKPYVIPKIGRRREKE
ncbi:MAG: ABC transporter ATP-binding protein, partial [Proteiniclasticum sp.]|nr:ABC transporter ATP-binding protein [Proteiniclasticum sp.]